MRHDPLARRSASSVLVCDNRAVHPTNEDIRAAVERVLASPSFANASRLSRFLRFVVERALAGDADRLKEYSIGIEVFDRDQRYDPRIDSIVRVEAGRLRTKLEEYYRGSGCYDAVEIRIQRGGYVPEFAQRTHAVESPSTSAESVASGMTASERAATLADSATATSPASREQDEPPQRVLRPHAPLRTVLVAGIALVAGVVAMTFWRDTDQTRTVEPVIAVLPFAPYSEDGPARVLAMRLTEGVSAELVRLDRFGVVPSTSAREFADARGSMRDVAAALEADFLLEARVLADGGVVRVEARLVDGAANRKIWVDTIAGDAADLDDLVRRVAAAAAAAPLNGAR